MESQPQPKLDVHFKLRQSLQDMRHDDLNRNVMRWTKVDIRHSQHCLEEVDLSPCSSPPRLKCDQAPRSIKNIRSSLTPWSALLSSHSRSGGMINPLSRDWHSHLCNGRPKSQRPGIQGSGYLQSRGVDYQRDRHF